MIPNKILKNLIIKYQMKKISKGTNEMKTNRKNQQKWKLCILIIFHFNQLHKNKNQHKSEEIPHDSSTNNEISCYT